MKKIFLTVLFFGAVVQSTIAVNKNPAPVPKELRNKWMLQAGLKTDQGDPTYVIQERTYPTAGREPHPTESFEVEGEYWEFEHFQQVLGWLASFFRNS